MLTGISANAFGISAENTTDPRQRASAYISAYYADTYARADGDISMSFTIVGSGRMESLGASSISLYEVNNGRITRVARYSQSTNPEFVATNLPTHSAQVVYSNAVSGRQYYAVVELFASKGGGSDSRTYTTALVTAK
jgi:hypothetical protein